VENLKTHAMSVGLFRVSFFVKYSASEKFTKEEEFMLKKTIDSLVEAFELQDRVQVSFSNDSLQNVKIFSEDNLNELLKSELT